MYLCLSKCQHFVPYKQFKIYRFKQVYGALCKPNHHKMYRYWEIHVKILCIMWMRSQGASSSTTIIQQKKSKHNDPYILINQRIYTGGSKFYGKSIFLKRKFKACQVTSVNFYFTFPRKIFLLFKLHVSILFQIKSISHYWLNKERFWEWRFLDWMICNEGLDITSKVEYIYIKIVWECWLLPFHWLGLDKIITVW